MKGVAAESADVPDDAFPDGKVANAALDLRHGYYAAVSHLDAMVGQVVEGLDSLGLTDRTIVIFLPDHGIHIGEQGLWSKGTLFELDTRVPLIVRYPDKVHRGAATQALTESIDIYPSLVDLAGLPPCADLEGTSFRPLMETPTRRTMTRPDA